MLRRLDAHPAAPGKRVLDHGEITAALRIAIGRDARGHVGDALQRIAGAEGVERVAEKTAASGPLIGDDRNVARNLRAGDRELMGADRADRRTRTKSSP